MTSTVEHPLPDRPAAHTPYPVSEAAALADGSAEDATGGRLTSAGVAAVAACESRGIMLDVPHLGAACTDHVLELATRPPVASHSSAFAVRPHHRNLTEHAVPVAGIDHVGLGPDFIQAVSEGLACADDLTSGTVRPRREHGNVTPTHGRPIRRACPGRHLGAAH
ncbi:MAG TPA: membrane dipeptidase [Pseudonocardia sp.]|nr:membrane dipeptidase [Pseudonocardia sp.]